MNEEWKKYWNMKNVDYGIESYTKSFEWGVDTANEWGAHPEYSKESELLKSETLEADVRSRFDDDGFIDDILSWLRGNAPRKVYAFLKSLCFPRLSGDIEYVDVCEAVYRMGFRASDVVERRLILGESNAWVRIYFEDFPLES